MSFTLIVIISFFIILYAVVAKRRRWIYWLNAMNNVIPAERRAKIDWEGYSNAMGNILAIAGFLLLAGFVAFSATGAETYFPLTFIPFLIILVWGQYGYAFRRFDKQAYSEDQRNRMNIRWLEYHNLDLTVMILSILLAGVTILFIK